MEEDVITLQDIFVFDRTGIDADGNVLGSFRATGIRPQISKKLEMAGIELDESIFAPGMI